MTHDTNAQHVAAGSALHRFLATWTGEMAADVATRLACAEVDALAALLTACGRTAAAAEWINHHSRGDDDQEDAHYRSPGTALRYELDELVAACVTGIELREGEPETFGAGHHVLYREDSPALRFAITELTDKPADDDTREVIGWTWRAERRDYAGPWVTEAEGTTAADDIDELITAAWTWATQ